MYLLLWILFGGIVGWLASLLTHNDSRMGIIANIVVGLVGAAIGGLISHLVGLGGVSIFTWTGLGFALLGSVILLLLVNAIHGNRRW